MFVFHIGLPKTATTSLQYDYFPQLVYSNQALYIGLNQPRHLCRQSQAYHSINNYISGDSTLESARSVLDALSANYKVIIFSDEMILVSSAYASWQTKLARLATLVHCYDFRILLAVRDPINASISYYVERYSSFFSKSYSECFQKENDFQIYNYSYLLDLIYSLGLAQSIDVVYFEDLIKNPRLALNPIHKHLSPHFTDKPFPVIRNRNTKNTLLERLRERPNIIAFYSNQNKVLRVLIRVCLALPMVSQLFAQILKRFFSEKLYIVSKESISDDEINAAREVNDLRYEKYGNWSTFMRNSVIGHD